MTETTAVRPLTESLTLFLAAIARGEEGGVLSIHCRSLAGVGYQHLTPPVPREPWAHLPPFALKLLEDRWGVRIGAGVRGPGGSGLASLGVLFAIFPVAVTFDSSTGWRHRAVAADVDAALARLDAFPLVSAFVIDGIEELVAVWALAEPLRDLDHARRLQRRLAELLGASTASVAIDVPSATMGGGHRIESPADDPAACLPFPGSIVRSLGDPPPIVTFTDVAPERVYTPDQFEAALGQEEHTP